MKGFNEITDFYRICKSVVKGYPAQYIAANEPEMVALRPNTFAVVRSLKDFDAENINKRPQFSNSPYFFSRHFNNSKYRSGQIKVEYPVVGFAEDRASLKLTKADKVKLDFFFIDQIPQFGDFYDDTYSKNREIEDVAKDIRDHFRKFIRILYQFAYCNVQGLPTGWYDIVWLQDNDYTYNELTPLDALVNLTDLQVEIFTGIVDNCVIGLTNIYVSVDGCDVVPPKIDYDIDSVEKFTNDVNC